MMKPRHAVVTGAGGFMGKRLVQLLQDDGWRTTAVYRRPSGDCTVYADLSVAGALRSHVDANSIIFHLAGSANVKRSVVNPLQDFSDNVVASLNVLETARESASAVVLISTGSVYEDTSAMPLSELSPLRPRSPYAAAKLAIEGYGQAYHQSYNMNVRVARVFSILGPGMRGMAIPDFIARLKKNPKSLSIRGDGNQVRDYLYVDDAARALLAITTHGKAGEVYNVGSGIGTKIRDLAAATAVTLGHRDCQIIPDGVIDESELHCMQADITKLESLGFRPKLRFNQALAKTVTAINKKKSDTA